mmetsp:Transcript_5118/g.15092  ORF Transcript_5118/g.15092 Transcript_5118/m.15092 type:complete len:347 (-) Transcript_5118:39-1079(-)
MDLHRPALAVEVEFALRLPQALEGQPEGRLQTVQRAQLLAQRQPLLELLGGLLPLGPQRLQGGNAEALGEPRVQLADGREAEAVEAHVADPQGVHVPKRHLRLAGARRAPDLERGRGWRLRGAVAEERPKAEDLRGARRAPAPQQGQQALARSRRRAPGVELGLEGGLVRGGGGRLLGPDDGLSLGRGPHDRGLRARGLRALGLWALRAALRVFQTRDQLDFAAVDVVALVLDQPLLEHIAGERREVLLLRLLRRRRPPPVGLLRVRPDLRQPPPLQGSAGSAGSGVLLLLLLLLLGGQALRLGLGLLAGEALLLGPELHRPCLFARHRPGAAAPGPSGPLLRRGR